MSYLKYDADKLEETEKTYRECVKTMEDLQKKMQTMVDDITDAWKTPAGSAFFAKYNDEWLKGFTQYQEVLTHFADCLSTASDEYLAVTRKANALKIK